MKGFLYAVFSSFFIASSFLLRKKLLLKNKINHVLFYVLIGMIITCSVILIYLNNTDKAVRNKLNFNERSIAICAGLLIPLGMYGLTSSLKYFSNPEYTGIIYAVFKTIILFILSLWFLNLSFNPMTFIGIILSLVGVVIILYYK